MYGIEGTDITLGKGESLIISIVTKGRVLADGTTAVLSVKEKLKDDTDLITKSVSIASREAVFEFLPADTADLKAKSYHWSLTVTDSSGNVSIPVEDGSFTVTEVV